MNDFSQGSVKKRIIEQAIPLTLAQVVQMLYNLVDRIYIGHCRPTLLPETPGHLWASPDQSPVGLLLLSPGSWYAQGSVFFLPRVCFPGLCKFWQLLAGKNRTLCIPGSRRKEQ